MTDELISVEEKYGVGCASCGACCELVSLKSPKSGYRFLLEHMPQEAVNPDEWENAQWIVTHFHEIEREMAVMINPRRVWQGPTNSMFLCDAYDVFTKQCKLYDQRPPLCRGFPLYGYHPEAGEVKGGLGAFVNCSFWHLYPKDEWPDWIDPLPNPLAAPPRNCC